MHIIHGALELEHKKANDICESWHEEKKERDPGLKGVPSVSGVPSDTLLTLDTMAVMLEMGHSRLMVYKGTPQAKSINVMGADDPSLNGYYERESLEASIYKRWQFYQDGEWKLCSSGDSSIIYQDGEWKLCSAGDVGEWTYSRKGGREYAPPGDWLHRSLPNKKVSVDADTRQVLGLVVLKRLICVNPEDKRELEKTLGRWRRPLVFHPDMSCLQVLNEFQEGKSHIGILSPDPQAVKDAWKNQSDIPKHALPVGFLTLEDVIEELLKEEVFDEEDRNEAYRKMGKVWGMVQNKAADARAQLKARQLRGEPSPKPLGRKNKTAPNASPGISPRGTVDLGQPLLSSVDSRQADNSRSSPSRQIQTAMSARRTLAVDRKT